MYSDPFAVLGLDPNTATDADVRKAYAARLKVTRPEDDREGFIALRAAFEDARSEVRARERYGNHFDEDDEEDEDGAVQTEAALTEGFAADVPAGRDDPGNAFEATAFAPPQVDTSAGSADSEAFDDQDSHDDDYLTETDRNLNAAMAALQAALQDPWGAKSGERVLAIVEAPEVSGIDEYQALQWRVRDWLCEETGYFADPRKLTTPAWLSLAELEALDAYFGWTAQPSRQVWIRERNDWIGELKERLRWESLPFEVRKQRELDKLLGKGPPPDRTPVHISKGHSRWDKEPKREKKRSGMFWFWVGFGILAFNILRALG
ncbi:hypothetical protein K1X12_10115 [Hyphomonas sp. WL0036]|uniref:hypothetical protein n=1 Tax=Hyphomonas sediminis TaxID=2866160 RepID=UPI001C8014D2|nr:hypothetical protein [Hyphomonas sediminis]MBY9067255.1 hypothetical protein [Hyphomonas sediminis]